MYKQDKSLIMHDHAHFDADNHIPQQQQGLNSVLDRLDSETGSKHSLPDTYEWIPTVKDKVEEKKLIQKIDSKGK